uniref:ORF31 n=1 Tax=Malaco herpesvirus 2 TaxID=3031798 RepID=A0AA48SFE0_9VIRU|nr:TPA_asm: ORF31 [Malaco herpesvirus 2]
MKGKFSKNENIKTKCFNTLLTIQKSKIKKQTKKTSECAKVFTYPYGFNTWSSGNFYENVFLLQNIVYVTPCVIRETLLQYQNDLDISQQIYKNIENIDYTNFFDQMITKRITHFFLTDVNDFKDLLTVCENYTYRLLLYSIVNLETVKYFTSYELKCYFDHVSVSNRHVIFRFECVQDNLTTINIGMEISKIYNIVYHRCMFDDECDILSRVRWGVHDSYVNPSYSEILSGVVEYNMREITEQNGLYFKYKGPTNVKKNHKFSNYCQVNSDQLHTPKKVITFIVTVRHDNDKSQLSNVEFENIKSARDKALYIS